VTDQRVSNRASSDGTASDRAVSDRALSDRALSDRAVSDAAVDEDRGARAVLIVLRLFRALERLDTGLTPQQYRIMKLAGAGGERSARLAERLAVAKPTLTATADGLVAAGLAQREAEPGDRRVVRLRLTAAGRAALARADAAYSRWLDQLLGNAARPDQVLETLDALGDAMDELRRSRHVAVAARKDQA
jgi:DNA-binding MarR family transcriptional regulator